MRGGVRRVHDRERRRKVDCLGESGYAGTRVRGFHLSFRRSKAFAVALATGSLTLFGSRGVAVADQEWHAGGRAGIAVLSKTGVEPALGLHGAYGLSDMFDVTVEVLGSHHVGRSGTDVLSACGGLAYKIDVFEWIPYVAGLVGYYGY